MRFRIAILSAALLVVMAVAVSAQVNVVPRNTVVPVILENTLNSATNNIGDRFTSYCPGPNCGGFPVNTRFNGVVTAITRASGNIPGQIGVSFNQAVLPDGRTIPISGQLTSLDPNAVAVDPNTGLLTGRPGTDPDRNRFIAYGAGAGVLIGAITGNVLRGGLIGAAAGWLYGATLGRGERARDVTVPAGTQFGVLLTQAVTVGQVTPPVTTPPVTRPPVTTPPVVTPPGRGPEVCPRELVFAGTPAPFVTTTGVAMVPARATMDALGVPFRYDTRTQRLTINTIGVTATHQVGTSLATVNNRQVRLMGPSRMVNGNLYVPTDFVAALTGRPVTWQPATGTLFIQ